MELAPERRDSCTCRRWVRIRKEFLKAHKLGDIIKVEVSGIDQMGKISLKLEGVEVTEEQRRERKPYPRNEGRNRNERNRK